MEFNSVVLAGNNSPHVAEGQFEVSSDSQINIQGGTSLRVVEMLVTGDTRSVNKAREGLGFARKGTAELHADIELETGKWASVSQLEFDAVRQVWTQQWD
jgi:hypothetical protein